MDIQQLKNFLVLTETLNFRKAADQVNIVQPALSRQMQLLEKEIGALLFNRNKRTVTLTSSGLYFQKEATRIIQDLHKVMGKTAQLHNGEAGELIVTHASSAINTVVPRFLVRVKEKWPGLKTIVQETSNLHQLEMVLTRKADIGIAPNIALPPEMNAKVLYKENFVLILPKNHPASKKSLQDLSVLKNEPFILPEFSEGIGYVETILAICQQQGFKPNIVHESAHSTAVLRLVEAGLGVSIEPMSSVLGSTMNVKLIELKNIAQNVEMKVFWLKEREEELRKFVGVV